MPDTSDLHRQVRELKRKHQEEAVLRNDGQEDGSIFWSKKVEQDLKHDKMVRLDDETVRREREAELERVRARRCCTDPSSTVLAAARGRASADASSVFIGQAVDALCIKDACRRRDHGYCFGLQLVHHLPTQNSAEHTTLGTVNRSNVSHVLSMTVCITPAVDMQASCAEHTVQSTVGDLVRHTDARMTGSIVLRSLCAGSRMKQSLQGGRKTSVS